LKKSKKGVSLVFVIVAVMMLMIFSSMLFTASASTLSRTAQSTDSRQTYMTARSIIEYMRMKAFEKAKTPGLSEFAGGPDSKGYFKEIAWPVSGKPDGKSCYAVCSGSGSEWEIQAKVKYRNSEKYQTMNYKFTLSGAAPVSVLNGYFLAGSRYDGTGQFLNDGDGTFNQLTDKTCPYPVVFNCDVEIAKGTTTSSAPEMYFVNTLGMKEPGSVAILNSNFIYFKRAVTSDASGQGLKLENTVYNSKISFAAAYAGYNGVARFDSSTPVQGGTRLPEGAGYYLFKNGTDLLDSSSYTNGNLQYIAGGDITSNSVLAPSSELKTSEFSNNIDYLNNYDATVASSKIVSSETDGGIGWTQEGKLNASNINSTKPRNQDVHLNLCPDGLNEIKNLTFPLTFSAHSINFQAVDSADFTMPNTTFTFDIANTSTSSAGALWLNFQPYNGYVWEQPWSLAYDASGKITGMNNETTKITVPAGYTNAHFFVGENNPSKYVYLILPHGLVIDNKATGFNFTLPIPDGSDGGKKFDSHDTGTCVYQLPSGTDILNDPNLMTDMKRITVSGGSGGGFSFTNERFTDKP
jgi:hypothetical protein